VNDGLPAAASDVPAPGPPGDPGMRMHPGAHTDPGMHMDPGAHTDPGVRTASSQDADRLTAVLADAFFDDPIFGWLIPDERRRRRRLRRFFAIELRHFALTLGSVWTTSDLLGAALILPPGAWRMPVRATLMEGRVFGAHIARAASMSNALEARHVREPHHYVRDIGVLPAAQGRGLGSALLRPTLERCDREGLPAYLEASSEHNARLYERLGFRLVDELRIADSPPVRLMLRPPS
jgi:GNAT superfamily N-acetyltransferase